jgi:hypothetical protein
VPTVAIIHNVLLKEKIKNSAIAVGTVDLFSAKTTIKSAPKKWRYITTC